jgi:hypothetical protein
MESGFGFHWGTANYWSASLSLAQAERERVRQHADDNCLPWPSQVTEFGRDDYEDTIIID